jgi:hypothetical protein
LAAGLDSLRLGLAWAGPGSACRGDDEPAAAQETAVAEQLVLPLRLVDDWPEPAGPLPVGGGAIHADLIDEDRVSLARLRAALAGSLGPGRRLDAESLAAEAQLWRLAVTPYRSLPGGEVSGDAAGEPLAERQRPATGGAGPTGARLRPASDHQPLAGRLVVDLSVLWAGPLATSLLAELGAAVVKIDPSCRQDGFREHPELYSRLNGNKEILDLDLRVGADRRRFEALVSGADLVVDSFSRRVMPNLGYGPDQLRALRPSVASLSIVAFPAGSPEQDWVAYGSGVHAASGLAAVDTGVSSMGGAGPRFRPAPVAYPDALAGLAAFAAGAELLSRPGPSNHREVSLAGAIAPLVDQAAAVRTTP